MTFPFPFAAIKRGSGGPAAPVAGLGGSYSSTADSLNYSFADCAYGLSASATRLVVVLLMMRGLSAFSGAVSAVSIGGISATRVSQLLNSGEVPRALIAYANVPTGTSGTVNVACTGFGTGMAHCAIEVWSLNNLQNMSAYDSDYAFSAANPLSVPIDIPANGFAFAAFSQNTSGGAYAWTNATGSYSAQPETGRMQTAKRDATVAETATAISIATGATSGSLAVASFG